LDFCFEDGDNIKYIRLAQAIEIEITPKKAASIFLNTNSVTKSINLMN